MQGRLSQTYPFNLPPVIAAIVASVSAAMSKQDDDKDNQSAEGEKKKQGHVTPI